MVMQAAQPGSLVAAMRPGAASWLRLTCLREPRLCAALSCVAAAVVTPPTLSEHSSSSSAAQATGAEPQPQPPTSMVFSKLDGVTVAIRASFARDPATACLVPELLLDLDSAGAAQVAAACVAAGAGAGALPRVDEGKVQTPADNLVMPPPVKVKPKQASNEHAPPPNPPGASSRSASRQKKVDGLKRLPESFRSTDSSPRRRQSGANAHVGMQRAGSMASGMPLLATLIELRVPASGGALNDRPCAALLALLDNTMAPADGTGSHMQHDLLGSVLLQNELSLAYWGNMKQLGEKGGPTMVRAMLPAEDAIDMLRTAAQCWRARADKPEELPLHAPWKRALELPVCYKLQGRLVGNRIVRVPSCEQRGKPKAPPAALPTIPAPTLPAPIIPAPTHAPRSPRSPRVGQALARRPRSLSVFEFAPGLTPVEIRAMSVAQPEKPLRQPELSDGSFSRLRLEASGRSFTPPLRTAFSGGPFVQSSHGQYHAMSSYEFTGLGMTGGMSPRVMGMLSSIRIANNSREGGSKRDSSVGSIDEPPVPRSSRASSGINGHSRSTLLRVTSRSGSDSGGSSSGRHHTPDVHTSSMAEHARSPLGVSDASSSFHIDSFQLWASPDEAGKLLLEMPHAASASSVHAQLAAEVSLTHSVPEDSVWPAFEPQAGSTAFLLQRKASVMSDDSGGSSSDSSLDSKQSSVASEEALVPASASPEAGKTGDENRWQEMNDLLVLDPARQHEVESVRVLTLKVSLTHVLGGLRGSSDLS
ncbi:hypothetical protein FOA52_006297 [Chlamydomonas sp. UWO 241]|nr:hypothetical protein FOA52_006297 [Chlamydomonas sp. UWO 241]